MQDKEGLFQDDGRYWPTLSYIKDYAMSILCLKSSLTDQLPVGVAVGELVEDDSESDEVEAVGVIIEELLLLLLSSPPDSVEELVIVLLLLDSAERFVIVLLDSEVVVLEELIELMLVVSGNSRAVMLEELAGMDELTLDSEAEIVAMGLLVGKTSVLELEARDIEELEAIDIEELPDNEPVCPLLVIPVGIASVSELDSVSWADVLVITEPGKIEPEPDAELLPREPISGKADALGPAPLCITDGEGVRPEFITGPGATLGMDPPGNPEPKKFPLAPLRSGIADGLEVPKLGIGIIDGDGTKPELIAEDPAVTLGWTAPGRPEPKKLPLDPLLSLSGTDGIEKPRLGIGPTEGRGMNPEFIPEAPAVKLGPTASGKTGPKKFGVEPELSLPGIADGVEPPMLGIGLIDGDETKPEFSPELLPGRAEGIGCIETPAALPPPGTAII